MREAIESIAVDMQQPRIAYAFARRGLYVTAPDGGRWSLVAEREALDEADRTVVVDPNRAGVAYTSIDRTLVRTEDGGQTWSDARGDLARRVSPPGGSNYVRPLAVVPGNSDVVYAAVNGINDLVLAKTIDGGATWKDLPALGHAECCRSLFAASADRAYLLKWEGLLARTDDGGQTWTSLHAVGLPRVLSLLIDPSDRAVLYAIGPENYDEPSGKHRLRKSIDGGDTWSTPSSQALPARLAQIAVDAEGRLYARASAGPDQPSKLFVSSDGGETFATADRGLESHDVSAIGAGSSCVAYAGTRGGGIFRTTSGAGNCPPP
jgi:photosystem II stability/assembly factor-like uncharacterized protein